MVSLPHQASVQRLSSVVHTNPSAMISEGTDGAGSIVMGDPSWIGFIYIYI